MYTTYRAWVVIDTHTSYGNANGIRVAIDTLTCVKVTCRVRVAIDTLTCVKVTCRAPVAIDVLTMLTSIHFYISIPDPYSPADSMLS